MVARHALFALGALILGAGCHAGLSGNTNTAKQEPPIPRETVTVRRFIDQHNKNAMAVRSLTAQPRIGVSYKDDDGKTGGGGVNGRLALERPRGFRLNLRGSVGGDVADIGSNDKEFWFWVKDNKDKAIYVCDHKDVNATELAVTYQPDWITEAMGFREIDPTEALTLAATRPADKPGLLVLTQRRKDNQGGMLTKETIVDESNGHIIEHRLWAGAKKDLLARATISQYKAYRMEPTEENPSGSTIEIPDRFKLEWVAEKFSLDVSMAQVKVNPAFPRDQRTALFTEPQPPNAKRKDLAQLANPAVNGSKVYESMPAPAPRSGVRLGAPEPVPMGIDGAMRTNANPGPLTADLALMPSPQPEAVIGAPIPRGTDPEAVQSSSTRSSWRPPSLIR